MADYSEFKPSAGDGYDYPQRIEGFVDKVGEDMTAKASAQHIHDAGDPPILETYPDGNQSATGAKHIGLNTDSDQVEVIDTDGSRIIGPVRLPLLAAHPASPPPAGSIYKYAVDVGGAAEEFTMDSAGNTVQLTSGGSIMGGDVTLYETSVTLSGGLGYTDVTVDPITDQTSFWPLGVEFASTQGAPVTPGLEKTSSTNIRVHLMVGSGADNGTYTVHWARRG